jgi:hypothetical protein
LFYLVNGEWNGIERRSGNGRRSTDQRGITE